MYMFSDYFTASELLASIAKAPYVPGRLSEFFEVMQLTGTKLSLENQATNAATILAGVPRGTPSRIETLERRNVYDFETTHIRVDGAVYADEVLNVRSVGTNAVVQVLQQRRDELIARERRDIDLTLESLRVACVTTPTNAFGNVPSSQQIALNTDATKTRAEIFTKIIAPIETALGGVPYTGIQALCDDAFWAKLIENASVRATLLNYSMAQSLRNDPREAVFFGGVMWERYRGTGTVVIPSGEARVFPTGVSQLFIQAFAPADTLDSVGMGALGTPYYLQAIPSSDNRRWHIETQSNAATVCTRPTAVLPITTN